MIGKKTFLHNHTVATKFVQCSRNETLPIPKNTTTFASRIILEHLGVR
jgi:hypothetical protein